MISGAYVGNRGRKRFHEDWIRLSAHYRRGDHLLTLGRWLGSKKGWTSAPVHPLVRSKLSRILELAEGKDVLDCGCVGARLEDAPFEYDGNTSASGNIQIAKVARSCLGVDIWGEEVEKRRQVGLNVVTANVETMRLGKTFDLIVAGDLIEHLANPGEFLSRAFAHLRDQGYLCIVTPNAFSVNTVLKSLLGIGTQVNAEHTCWYDPTTLGQLLKRYGFAPIEWYWQDYGRNPLASAIVSLRPSLAAHFICIAERHPRVNLP